MDELPSRCLYVKIYYRQYFRKYKQVFCYYLRVSQRESKFKSALRFCCCCSCFLPSVTIRSLGLLTHASRVDSWRIPEGSRALGTKISEHGHGKTSASSSGASIFAETKSASAKREREARVTGDEREARGTTGRRRKESETPARKRVDFVAILSFSWHPHFFGVFKL